MSKERYALGEKARVVIHDDGEVSIQVGEVTAWGPSLGECFEVDSEIKLSKKHFKRLSNMGVTAAINARGYSIPRQS